nr:transposase-associated domain-containing protein [Tanacetum cinerariifolium]
MSYLLQIIIDHDRDKTLDGIIDPDIWKQIETRSLNILVETAEHKNIIKGKRSRRIPKFELEKIHCEQFSEWFRKRNSLYSIPDTCDVPSLHRNEVDGNDEIDVIESMEDEEEEEEDTY